MIAPELEAELDAILAEIDADDLLDIDPLAAAILDTSRLPQPSTTRHSPVAGVERRRYNDDAATFEPVFDEIRAALADGTKALAPFAGVGSIVPGAAFVTGGLVAHVAGIDEATDRLHLVFSNGTVSRMYRRSLAARLSGGRGRVIV